MTRALPISGLIFLIFPHTSQYSFAADTTPLAAGNPFGYCAAVRNIDVPAGGASPVPSVLMPYLASAPGLAVNSTLPQGYYWRCMNGAVYICAVGANIPCGAKADLARRNVGAENYCRENPRATFVPAYATGHASIYSWSCSAGNAVPGKRLAKVDRRGFRVDFWHRLKEIPKLTGTPTSIH